MQFAQMLKSYEKGGHASLFSVERQVMMTLPTRSFRPT